MAWKCRKDTDDLFTYRARLWYLATAQRKVHFGQHHVKEALRGYLRVPRGTIPSLAPQSTGGCTWWPSNDKWLRGYAKEEELRSCPFPTLFWGNLHSWVVQRRSNLSTQSMWLTLVLGVREQTGKGFFWTPPNSPPTHTLYAPLLEPGTIWPIILVLCMLHFFSWWNEMEKN